MSAIFVSLIWPVPSQQDLIGGGDRAYQRGDLQSAFSYFHRATLQSPNDPAIHLKLSHLYEQVKNYDQALAEVKIAQNLNFNLHLQGELSRLSSLQDEPQQIRSEIAQTVAIVNKYPDFKDAWVKLAYLHYQLREPREAKKALAQALIIDPSYAPATKLESLLP